jgi:hypothetical protein
LEKVYHENRKKQSYFPDSTLYKGERRKFYSGERELLVDK